MSDIDPIEFGRLQAQVETLIAVVEKMVAKVDSVEKQLTEAKGGWRMLMAIGGASASAGGMISWAVSHFSKGTP